MSDKLTNGKIILYPPEVHRRLEKVEEQVSGQDGKLDQIIACTAEIKSDVRSVAERQEWQQNDIEKNAEMATKNTSWINQNKKIVYILSLVVVAATVAALTGVDISAVL